MPEPRQFPSLPPLAGLDTAEGLKRFEEDQAFYLSILFKFHDRQGDFVDRVRRLLSESGDRGAARREAHTLKGLAVAIGAKELSNAAYELERGIGAGAETPAGLRLLDEVGARLSEVLAAIGGIEHLRTSEPVVSPKPDDKALATLIDEARELLAAFDVEVERPVRQLCGALAGTTHAECVMRMRELVSRYDYVAARAELEALALAI